MELYVSLAHLSMIEATQQRDKNMSGLLFAKTSIYFLKQVYE
jgi:hypothetical protein